MWDLGRVQGSKIQQDGYQCGVLCLVAEEIFLRFLCARDVQMTTTGVQLVD